MPGGWPGRDPVVAERFDLFIGRWQQRSPVPQVSKLVSTDGSANLFGYVDATVNALVAKSRVAATDPEERTWTHGLHARLAEDRPLLFLWSKDVRSAWRKEIKKVFPSPIYYYTRFDQWRWTQDEPR